MLRQADVLQQTDVDADLGSRDDHYHNDGGDIVVSHGWAWISRLEGDAVHRTKRANQKRGRSGSQLSRRDSGFNGFLKLAKFPFLISNQLYSLCSSSAVSLDFCHFCLYF